MRAHVVTSSSMRDPRREKDDFYRTPEIATLALLHAERVPSVVWEPACGDGAIGNVLTANGHTVIGTDLVARGYGEPRRDFLFERDLLAPAIITNPPFKLADEFVLHALSMGAEFVAMFMRLTWLEGRARHDSLWSKRPPARVHVFSQRLTLWRGDEVGRDAGGTIAFAWFVWQRGHSGDTALRWIAPEGARAGGGRAC